MIHELKYMMMDALAELMDFRQFLVDAHISNSMHIRRDDDNPSFGTSRRLDSRVDPRDFIEEPEFIQIIGEAIVGFISFPKD